MNQVIKNWVIKNWGKLMRRYLLKLVINHQKFHMMDRIDTNSLLCMWLLYLMLINILVHLLPLTSYYIWNYNGIYSIIVLLFWSVANILVRNKIFFLLSFNEPMSYITILSLMRHKHFTITFIDYKLASIQTVEFLLFFLE